MRASGLLLHGIHVKSTENLDWKRSYNQVTTETERFSKCIQTWNSDVSTK